MPDMNDLTQPGAYILLMMREGLDTFQNFQPRRSDIRFLRKEIEAALRAQITSHERDALLLLQQKLESVSSVN